MLIFFVFVYVIIKRWNKFNKNGVLEFKYYRLGNLKCYIFSIYE